MGLRVQHRRTNPHHDVVSGRRRGLHLVAHLVQILLDRSDAVVPESLHGRQERLGFLPQSSVLFRQLARDLVSIVHHEPNCESSQEADVDSHDQAKTQ